MILLAPIVEGHGETQSVPALLHRLAQRASAASSLRVNPPIRVKAGSFLNDASYFSRYITLAAAKAAQTNGSVLILLDCDDDCPAMLGPDLLGRARAVRADVRYLVCLARREYETWFIAAAPSLRGRLGLPLDLERPPDFENIRDAKGWLSSRMSSPYDPTVHQLDLTRVFDLQQAEASTSFAHLVSQVASIFRQ
jgi:Domain of unknown function (DUF4276)